MTYKIGNKVIKTESGYEQKEGNGGLWKNKKKQEGDRLPDYTGNINLDGEQKQIALWIKNENMVSVSVSEQWDSGLVGGQDFQKHFDEQNRKKDTGISPADAKKIIDKAHSKNEKDEFDDDIPF
tara:strand:+ start:432 stop:803 length:372 start_codon:yes stop_codon:yes gene_type:complete